MCMNLQTQLVVWFQTKTAKVYLFPTETEMFGSILPSQPATKNAAKELMNERRRRKDEESHSHIAAAHLWNDHARDQNDGAKSQQIMLEPQNHSLSYTH